MNLFYFDDEIKAAEKRLDFAPVIIHLEKRFTELKDSQTLATLIASAWFYEIEGDVNQKPMNYNWEFFQKKWKEYTDIALKEFKDDAIVCLITGYVLDLHWMHLGAEYDNLEQNLYESSMENSSDDRIIALARHWERKPSKKAKYEVFENAEAICKELFPSDSMLDEYFRQTLTNKII